MADPQAGQRKRLLFQSTRRGTKESDLILGGFAQAHLAGMDSGQLGRYSALLEQNDPDLLGWVIGTRTPPADHDNDVLALLIEFKNSLS
ncbi:MAG: succinate dehydrogenase assembly factor 2 [Alphaproteobacteria bacterium]|nr:succinate dehydrogenase assembly factor 2 [Alphaproteobacteria bacterium]